MTEQPIDRLHNRPPIVLPKDQEYLDHLKTQYPEIEKGVAEHEKAFATYADKDGRPLELTLKDADVAKALGDLIKQAKKDRTAWKAHGTNEKGPLTKLAKIVTNFFTGADEKIKALLDRYEPVLADYIKQVDAEAERLRQEEIERQRKKEEEARKAAEEQERQAREAEQAAAKKREEERLAREAAEKAKREKEEAEARAAAAKAEEKRQEEERREKVRAEKERNTAAIRDAKAILKSAERLNQLVEAEEATDAETALLADQIKPRGQISALMGPVSASPHLDEDQAAAVADISQRLQALRAAEDGRTTKRQAKAREDARRAEEREQARLAEQRRQRQADEDARLEASRKAREAEEAAAEKAAQERRDADARARAAREEARQHEKTVREADKASGRAADDADRAANRADRIEGRGESRANVRGELGSNSGLARRWCHYVDDEQAVRKSMGPLGAHIRLDAIEAAAYHWMQAHQDGFEGERVTPPELPGIRFALEEDLASR